MLAASRYMQKASHSTLLLRGQPFWLASKASCFIPLHWSCLFLSSFQCWSWHRWFCFWTSTGDTVVMLPSSLHCSIHSIQKLYHMCCKQQEAAYLYMVIYLCICRRLAQHFVNNLWAKASTTPFYGVKVGIWRYSRSHSCNSWHKPLSLCVATVLLLLQIEGIENLPPANQAAVYVSNHQSFLVRFKSACDAEFSVQACHGK